METLKKILKTIGTALVGAVLALAGLFLFKSKNQKSEKEAAEKAREDKKHELEEKTADDIAADSPNPGAISGNIEKEQSDLRDRIRDKLEQELPRNGSSENN